MDERRDPLPAAGRWTAAVSEAGLDRPGLVATVGRVEVEPNASNCIPRRVRTSLDVRHADDRVRRETVRQLVDLAAIKRTSQLEVEARYDHEHAATPMDARLTALLAAAAAAEIGEPAPELVSGAGHDAGVMAAVAPAAMLFVRCRGGVSHDPAEYASREDVTTALGVMVGFLEQLAAKGDRA
jgi:allantoate deiminase